MAQDFSKLIIHRRMLQDRVRCETYRKAIYKAVTPDSVVLDIGAGTGILSLFAVKAGAKKVYAVERTRTAEIARQLTKINGFDDCLEVIQEEIETVKLPEQVDIIVSEMMAQLGVDENMLYPLLTARDRWLKPSGKMLPELVSTWMVPIEDRELEKNLDFWKSRPYGLDLSLMAKGQAYYGKEVKNITKANFLSSPLKLWDVNMLELPIDEALNPLQSSISFPVIKEGKFSALAGWFSAKFDDKLVLTNALDASDTHWNIGKFSIDQALKVYPGMQISLEFTCEPVGSNNTHLKWSVRVEDGPWKNCEAL